ncbi:MAG: uroporphyrinogen decarboxylase family protein [Anaerolineae bacterium]|jgi:uroporphyrinogen decarboxylase
MNHRERVLTSLRHQEPDRVPLDLGGTVDSTILAVAYRALRDHMGLGPGVVRVADIHQHTALVEEDVRRALGIDVRLAGDLPLRWQEGVLPDGSPALFPDRFRPERQPDGSQVVFDAAGTVVLKMPRDGHYFDPVHSPLAGATSIREIDQHLDAIASYDKPAHLDTSYECLAQEAQRLREETDYLLVGFFGGHIFQSSQSLRGWDTFLLDLLINRRFAEALMDRLVQANIERFERYAETVGRYVDVIQFEDDLGMQDRPLLRPSLYRQVVKPYQARLFRFARSRCDVYLLLHTDGAVAPFIPDFIEMGIDILNPVQVSAAGMDTQTLKREFGDDIVFWGGGCDSQRVLPFGTPQEVADEARRRIDDLAPGGGFVFAPIHNIQSEVPPANVVAMFEAAREHGVY